MSRGLDAGRVRVSESTFIGLIWGGVGVTILFFTFRIYVRIRTFHRVFWDDAFVFVAWATALTNAIIWQKNKDALYQELAVTDGLVYSIPHNFPQNTERYLRGSIAVITFFYVSLWSVKVSFLIFFRRLGHNVKGQKYLWWFVLGITVASFLACLGTIEFGCLVSSFESLVSHCQSPGMVKLQRATLISNMVMDVVTDMLIISVPVTVLWKVRISMRQKLALAGIFSITVVIMIFAIVRVAVVISLSEEPDESWLYVWSSVEQTVAIMVACLASYRVLFVIQDRPTHLPSSAYSGGSGSGSLGVRLFHSKRNNSIIDLRDLKNQTSTVIHARNDSHQYPTHSFESTEPIISPNCVHVQNTISTLVSSHQDPYADGQC